MNHSTNSLKHTVWECKYHVVFIPKYRKKVIYGGLRSEDRRLDQLKMFE
jgi:putative transposase